MPFIGRGGSSPPSDTAKWEPSHPLTGDLPSNPSGTDPDAVTTSGMPRPAPPAPPHGRLRGAGPTRPSPSAHRPAAIRSVASPATGSVSGWAFGGSAPSAAELDALWLNTDLLGQREASSAPTAEDFTPLHSGTAAPAPAATCLAFTRLDAKGRLPLPQCPVLDVRLAAERDGAVLVVFLPAASGAPRPGYDTPLLRVDARRRLLLNGPMRAQLGLGDNATVVVRADADRNVLEVMAASRLEPHLDELFDAHRRDASTAGGCRAGLTALPGGRRSTPGAALPGTSATVRSYIG